MPIIFENDSETHLTQGIFSTLLLENGVFYFFQDHLQRLSNGALYLGSERVFELKVLKERIVNLLSKMNQKLFLSGCWRVKISLFPRREYRDRFITGLSDCSLAIAFESLMDRKERDSLDGNCVFLDISREEMGEFPKVKKENYSDFFYRKRKYNSNQKSWSELFYKDQEGVIFRATSSSFVLYSKEGFIFPHEHPWTVSSITLKHLWCALSSKYNLKKEWIKQEDFQRSSMIILVNSINPMKFHVGDADALELRTNLDSLWNSYLLKNNDFHFALESSMGIQDEDAKDARDIKNLSLKEPSRVTREE